jgi:hypothetical protein
MSPFRHITIDPSGRIYEVAHMYDRHARDTLDPALAVTCVVHLHDGRWWSADVADAPIYTVH